MSYYQVLEEKSLSYCKPDRTVANEKSENKHPNNGNDCSKCGDEELLCDSKKSKKVERGKENDELGEVLASLCLDSSHYHESLVCPVRYSGPGQDIPRSVMRRLEEMASYEYQDYITHLNSGELNQLMRRGQSWRRKSFPSTWPHANESNLSVGKMAAAGFYYNCITEKVCCPFCYRDLVNPVTPHKDLQTIHLNLSAGCLFVRKEFSDRAVNSGPKIPNLNPYSTDGFNIVPQTELLGISSYTTLKYSIEEHRTATFPNELCNDTHNDAVNAAIKDGFYYMRKTNQIRCHSCELAFALPDNNNISYIWFMHASTSPDCLYLIEIKGYLYVEQVRCANPLKRPMNSPIDRMVRREGGAVSCHFARYPDYVCQVERDNSVISAPWLSLPNEKKKALTDSGFFELNGEMKCFYCDLTIQSNRKELEKFDPMEYHSLQSANCGYLTQIRDGRKTLSELCAQSQVERQSTTEDLQNVVAHETPKGETHVCWEVLELPYIAKKSSI